MAERELIERPQGPANQDQPQPTPVGAEQPQLNPQSAPAAAKPPQPNAQPTATLGNVSGVVEQLKKERERAQKEVKGIEAAIAALGSLGSNGQPPELSPQPPLRQHSPRCQIRNLRLRQRSRLNQMLNLRHWRRSNPARWFVASLFR
jgi:hypothetical protein